MRTFKNLENIKKNEWQPEANLNVIFMISIFSADIKLLYIW